mmetsp:Transcript_36428/g.102901  ORF Transcript_36428/g.102901 Transcript_36428/m.102901 type:complete len:122 (-) Transcript_36428:82-447(-)|eukprot:CAMPEP_0117676954 /NCGR_PEP_ID=MMETSP0804-20121206/16487_1 /TAXON_ID=1074897 /ORGANISM="Tetraselmis astigmatica, Strain CCMP880" /LENGTH=121 /DNA_ID=CAMNT_0005486205 /DNA_START=120 /DNA_END=485 /DNA_ORIENTATION=+
MASRRLLEKLGEAAIRPSFHNGKWRKASISAKNAAKLRREDLLAGKEWPYEKPHKEVVPKPPKGHKRHKEEAARAKKVEENLATMDEKIAQYRESRKLKDIPLLDQFLLSAKELRLKAKAK